MELVSPGQFRGGDVFVVVVIFEDVAGDELLVESVLAVQTLGTPSVEPHVIADIGFTKRASSTIALDDEPLWFGFESGFEPSLPLVDID